MDIEPKDGVYYLSLAAAVGSGWAWVKSRLTGHHKRIKALESRVVDEKGEPLLMSYAAHDKICQRATGDIAIEMRHVAEAVTTLTIVVEGHTAKLSAVAETVAVLKDRSDRNEGGENV